MKKVTYLLSAIVVTLLLFLGNLAQLKAQDNFGTNCPSEITQFTELFHFGHGQATALDIHPEGTILAVAGADGVWLYNVEGLTPLHQLEFNSSGIQTIAWSPDGTKLAIYISPISPQQGIVIYDVQQQETLSVFKTEDHFTTHAYMLSWSPDGSKLIAAGTMGWRVWDTTNGQLLIELSDIITWPESATLFDNGLSHLLAWSPDSQHLALPDGKNIAILNTTTWEREIIFESDITRITSLDWSVNNQLAAVGQVGSVQVWDVESERVSFQVPINGDHFITRWSNDGKTLAVGAGSEIYLVDAQQQTTTQTLRGHLSWVYDFVWQTGDQILISLGREGSIYAWDVKTAQPMAKLTSYGEIGKPAWSPDGKLLAISLREGNGVDFEAEVSTVRVWNSANWEMVADLSINDPSPDFDSLMWSPDGHWLAIVTRAKILIWNVQQNWTTEEIEITVSSSIRKLTWSLDGNELAITTIEGDQSKQSGYLLGNVVRIWSMERQSFEFTLRDDEVAQVLPLSTPDGWMIITSTRNGIFIQTANNEKRNLSDEGYLVDVVNTSDGIMLASIVYTDNPQNNIIKIENTTTQKQTLRINGDYADEGYPIVGLSPNANLLKLRHNLPEYELWNVSAASKITPPDIVQQAQSDMFWSPDETCIAATLPEDSKIVIWDVITGRSLTILEGSGVSARNVTWSPNSVMLATSGEGMLTVWGYNT